MLYETTRAIAQLADLLTRSLLSIEEPSSRKRGSSLVGETIAEEAEEEAPAEEKAKDEGEAKPEKPSSDAKPGRRKSGLKREKRKSSKFKPGKENGADVGDEPAPEAAPQPRPRRERAIALPNIMEHQARSAKSLWGKGKMKLNAIRSFGAGTAMAKEKAQSEAKEEAAESKPASLDAMLAGSSPPKTNGTGGQANEEEAPAPDMPPARSMRKRQSIVVKQDDGSPEGPGFDQGGGRRRTSLMAMPGAPGMDRGKRESIMMGKRESIMMMPGDGRRQSMMQAPGHLAGGGNRRVSMMRRESSMMLPGGGGGGRRESTMFRRESTMLFDDRMGPRASVFGVNEMDATSRMSHRQSSVFLQSEFEQEMRRREKEAKQHKTIKIQSEEEAKKHEKAKAERLAQRDDVLTHNERVRRIIAKWKMR